MNIQDVFNSSHVVLVEFFANWCPHCQRMMPIVDQVRELVDGRAGIYQFDIDRNQEAADSVGVQSVPTFILLRDGKEIWRFSGEIEGDVLLAKIEEALK